MKLYLNFWGVFTEVILPHKNDALHFTYYFGDFIMPKTKNIAVSLLFKTSGNRPFITSLTNPKIKKTIFIKEGKNNWIVYDIFYGKSNLPSPIPPFSLRPLIDKYQLIHAAAVVSPINKSILIAGHSFSGKSVLTLALLNKNWHFLSDDIAVIDKNTLEVHPFSRPLGIRENTLNLLPWLRSMILSKKNAGYTYRINDSDTHMISIKHLFNKQSAEPSKLKGIYFLNNNEDNEFNANKIDTESGLQLLQTFSMIQNPVDDENLETKLKGLHYYNIHYNMNEHINKVINFIEFTEI